MHELSLMQAVVEMAAEAAGERRVKRVVLDIGRGAAVLPDAMRFCFELASADSPIQGAQLDIIESEGDHLRLKELEVA